MVESRKYEINNNHFVIQYLFLLFLLFSANTYSYVPSESTQRVPIRWNRSDVTMSFEYNSSDFSQNQTAQIINEVLNSWNASSPIPILNQPTSPNKFSFSSDPRFFGPGVVAVTILTYEPGDGKVNSGQILVNQSFNRGFCLTSNKSAMGCVYLGDVVSHEFGHLLGLSHSEVRESTMIFTSFKGQHTPHTDDIAGIRSIYQKSQHGTLSGTVMGGSRVPVFGAHVQAISTKLGTVVASAISLDNGNFTINGLDLEDTYYLYIEPLNHLESLPDAFRSAKREFCPNSYVGSFFESCGSAGKGHPQPLRLSSAKQHLDVGIVSIRCQTRVAESYLQDKIRGFGGQYEIIASAENPADAIVGFYNSTDDLPSLGYSTNLADTIEIDLTQLTSITSNSFLELNINTAAIGSPLDFSIEIDGPTGLKFDPDRQQFGGTPFPTLEAGTLRPLFDRKISYQLSSNSSLNRVSVKLQPRMLTISELNNSIPDSRFFALKDRPWFASISIRTNGLLSHVNQSTILQDNRNCLDAPFTYAVKANNVSAAAMSGQSEEEASSKVAAASCGTIEPPQSGGGGHWPITMLLGLTLILFIPKRSSRS
jgi:hypothetical protein